MKLNQSIVKKYNHLLLLGILLLSFGLRVYRLDFQSLRGDEGATYVYIIRPLAEILNILKITEPHPPLYHTLMAGWFKLAGGSEFALRFPTVVAGLLIVASLAVLGRLIWDTRLAVVVALLTAVNPYQVFYAQDARPYPLATLLGVLSTIYLWWAIKHRRWREWIIYGILILAGMYAHYYAAFIVVFQGLFVLWDAWQRRRFPWRYTLIGLAAVLLYLPWLFFIWDLFIGYGGFGETVGIIDSLWRPLVAFAGGQFLSSQTAWLYALIVAVPLLCLGAIGLWRKNRPAGLLSILYLAVPLLAVFLASLSRPLFNERYLIMASPGFLLLTTAGLITLLDARWGWLKLTSLITTVAMLVISGVALSNYYANPQYAKSPPWRDVLQYITQESRAGDALVYTAPLPPVLYYNQGRLPVYLVPFEPDTPLPKAVEQLRGVLDRHPRIWLLPTAPNDWEVALQMEPWLDRHTARLDQVFFRALHIGLYESPTSFANTMTLQSARFEDGIQLEGFRIGDGQSSLSIERGETIPLTLLWRAEHPPTTAYTVFTHLVGPDGMLWGQWDNPPVWGTFPTDQWSPGESVFDQYAIPVKEDAPPDEYHLLVGMYDPQSGERLAVLEGGENPTDDHVQLNQPIIIE